jgi:hypothetical protein
MYMQTFMVFQKLMHIAQRTPLLNTRCGDESKASRILMISESLYAARAQISTINRHIYGSGTETMDRKRRLGSQRFGS